MVDLVTRYKPAAGESIYDAAEKAIQMARIAGQPVQMIHNDTEVLVCESHEDQVVIQWSSLRKNK